MLRKWLVAVMAVAFLVGGVVGCEPQDEPKPKPKTKTSVKLGTAAKAETAPKIGTAAAPKAGTDN